MGKYTLIIFDSQDKKSFSNEILSSVEKSLTAKKKSYKLIDLAKDKFNPVYTGKELALYSKGEAGDKNVQKYIELVKEAKEIIFIFKTIWQGPTARTKGFIDKVFLKNHFWYGRKTAYFDALWGTMTWMKSTIAITYQDTSKRDYKKSRKAIKNQFIRGIFFALHTHGKRFLILHDEKKTTKKTKFLAKIAKAVERKL